MSFKRNILLVLLIPFAANARDWQMQPTHIATRWATSVDPSNVWPDYPRPQLVRAAWENLNGLWEYAITESDSAVPKQYQGRILVPFPVESPLSGVKRPLRPDQLLWYRRTFEVRSIAAGERILLNFGAVDYEATVSVNGKKVGAHKGGYQSFSFEITDAIRKGDNEIVVRVLDPTDAGPNPHGKQNLHGQFMYYTPSSGIWQTVWLERVPATYIESLKLTPDATRGALGIEVKLNGEQEGYAIEAIAESRGKVVARQSINGTSVLVLDQPRLWSPDDPHLYDLQLNVSKDGRIIDSVKSYFGLRKVELKRDEQGRARIHLNDRYTFNLGVVDQGFWPDGLYTAPNDAALKFDVQAAKSLGFNTIRKHLKIEPQRWYYHCDKLGVLVWQDMPSSNNDSPAARAQFEQEIERNLSQLHNHPSITTWVLFNEGWGAYDQERLAARIRRMDPSRLLNGHSGPYDHVKIAQWQRNWKPNYLLHPLGGDVSAMMDEFQMQQLQAPTDWMIGDVVDLHFYPGPRMFPARADAASVAGEFGSFGAYIDGHAWEELGPVGLGLGASRLSPPQMLAAYSDAVERLRTLESQGLSGASYFQVVDVEREHQGFFTYDREIAKLPVKEIERLNAKLVPRPRNYAESVAGLEVKKADWIPESQRYKSLTGEFHKGRRELQFLKRLALMALRQKDQPQATLAGDAYIALAPRPYTREIWQTIFAFTNTSEDSGFELIRNDPGQANLALGSQQAQKKVSEIIRRERVIPYFQSGQRSITWAELENALGEEFGELGRESVKGALMIEHLVKAEWSNFGISFIRYFETATERSPYYLPSLCHHVLANVHDRRALEAAVRVMQWQIDSPREAPVFGRYDPVELDIYANLLFKVGRVAEAFRWQEKAVALSGGRDASIVENLEKIATECRRAGESVCTS